MRLTVTAVLVLWGLRSRTCLSLVLPAKSSGSASADRGRFLGLPGLCPQPFSCLVVCPAGSGISLTLGQQVRLYLAAVLGAGDTKIAEAWALPSSK